MENQEVNQPQGEDLSNWSFTTPEEIIQNSQPDQEEVVEQAEEQPQVEAQEVEDQQEVVEQDLEESDLETVDLSEDNQEQEISEDDLEGAVLSFLSERLGRDIDSLDDINQAQQEVQLDERVEAIAKFVSETGRDPRDWFLYQSLNASEMDDMTAISVQMSTQYPNLSQEEITTLVGSKYKLDSNLHTEEEIRLSQLQLKMDAQGARDAVSQLRDEYAAPVVDEQGGQDEPFVTEQWLDNMATELDALESVEFDLGNGETFNFGLDQNYKVQLAGKNARLEEFFDPYVQEDGEWNHDKFNVHMAVLDNIETIVSSVYSQGMADGKRGLVDQAANVNAQSPNQGGTPQSEDSLTAQLREALGGGSGLSFNNI